MPIWKYGEQKTVVFFDFAVGVTVGYGLNDDGSFPTVGQPFLIRVLVNVEKGGFPVRVILYEPAHVRIQGSNFGKLEVLNTKSVPFRELLFEFQAIGRCELSTVLDAELRCFTTQDIRYPIVNLEVANAPFPNPVPEPLLGKVIFGRGPDSRFVVNTDGSGERRIDFKPSNYSVGILSREGSRRVALREDGWSTSLWVENYDGGNDRQLPIIGSATACQWSFDGSKIMYWSFANGRGALRVIDADGTNDFEAVASTDTTGDVVVSYGCFMRDNRWAALSFRRSTGLQRLIVGTFTAAFGEEFTAFVEKTVDLNPDYIYRHITSNGNHDVLAMEAESRHQASKYEIHLWSILAGHLRIDSLNASRPSYSPDGNWIVFCKRSSDDQFISRVDINFLTEVKMSKTSNNPAFEFGDFEPSWAPL